MCEVVERKEWRCFHCDEVFTTQGLARDHFGIEQSQIPGCLIKAGAERGLLQALRKAEKDADDAWEAIHSESTMMYEAMRAQSARHADQLQTIEELGYERGLKDSQKELARLYEIERLYKEQVNVG